MEADDALFYDGDKNVTINEKKCEIWNNVLEYQKRLFFEYNQ